MASQNTLPERVSLAAMMRKRCGLQTPEEIKAEKASRGTLARMKDDVVVRKAGQAQTQARR